MPRGECRDNKQEPKPIFPLRFTQVIMVVAEYEITPIHHLKSIKVSPPEVSPPLILANKHPFPSHSPILLTEKWNTEQQKSVLENLVEKRIWIFFLGQEPENRVLHKKLK